MVMCQRDARLSTLAERSKYMTLTDAMLSERSTATREAPDQLEVLHATRASRARDMSQSCVEASGRTRLSQKTFDGASHSPQCGECDRLGPRCVRGRVRRRASTQNSVQWDVTL